MVTAVTPVPSVIMGGGIATEPSRKPYHPWPAMLGTTCIFQRRKLVRSRRTVMVLWWVPVGAEMMAPAGMVGAEDETNAPAAVEAEDATNSPAVVESCAGDVIARERDGGERGGDAQERAAAATLKESAAAAAARGRRPKKKP